MNKNVEIIPKTCDIFCTVIDNYGDIGVCWRLARQLAHEYGIHVRLWVDDLRSFAKLCPDINVELALQQYRGIEIQRWNADFHALKPAELVIEAFACKLPESYIALMAAQTSEPLWINLEYLSAENWVEGCHLLPSPHPRLALTKYFFFPGFTEKTGGLILENNLLAQRDQFQVTLAAKNTAFWNKLGISEPSAGELRISLFSYENNQLNALLETWINSATPIICLVPEGKILPQLSAYFGQAMTVGAVIQLGNLRVQILPFVEQADYDHLLWACDINFVRGEDSCVRAQWAGKPFIWQIYPQNDGVHLEKLRALSQLYGANLSPNAAHANENLWLAWNGTANLNDAWANFMEHQKTLASHAKSWAQQLSSNNLTLNLLDFWRQVGKIRAFKNS